MNLYSSIPVGVLDSQRVPSSAVKGLPRRAVLLGVVVFAVAFSARLLPLARGGGLFGIGGYDDGVYFGSALGLVNGLMPYRDFVMLHPPGVTLALAPSAALSYLTSDATAFAVARMGMMVLGAVNAVLVMRLLYPVGLMAATAGGLFFGLYYPAALVERKTLLEGFANLCLLISLLILARLYKRLELTSGLALAAGVPLGVAASIKIWGVVAIIAVVAYVWATKRGRAALLVALGAAVGGSAVYLPFFVSAPSNMWRMVVLDQVGRPDTDLGYLRRLNALTGLTPFRLVEKAPALILFATGCVVLAAVLACAVSKARLPVTLLAAMGTVMMATPSFFTHYAAAIAVPMALVIGAAVGVASTWLAHRRRSFAVAAAVAGLAILLGLALPHAILTVDRPFPARELSRSTATVSGCVTSDEPTTLIELDLISQNIDRGCSFVIDLGGLAYDRTKLNAETLASSTLERYELTYLTGGDVVVLARSSSGFGFHPIDQEVTDRWFLIQESGKFRVYRPS